MNPSLPARPHAPAPRLPHGLHQPAPDTAELEAALSAVESRIADLGDTLASQDPRATEEAAARLRQALGGAMSQFAQVARRGIVPPPLRQRLAVASARMAAQREALARATSSLDQALEILLPGAAPMPLYSAYGQAARGAGGQILAAS